MRSLDPRKLPVGRAAGREVHIPLLHVALQEGFAGDTVVLRLDGRELFRKVNVTTRLQTGYADSVEMDASAQAGWLEVEVPSKGLTLAFELRLHVGRPTYVGVSIQPDGRLSRRITEEPFGYL